MALSRICPERVLAFNVGSADARHDEASDAALVSRTLGLEFQSYLPTDRELAQGLRNFVAVQDQPIGDPAALPYFLAMRRLPDDCRVIFDGTGNDYYFGVPDAGKGLQRYGLRLDMERWVPGAAWPAIPWLLGHGSGWMRALAGYWQRPIEETFVAWEGWSDTALGELYGRPVSFDDTYLWTLMRGGSKDRWLELLTDVVCRVWEPHTAYRKAHHFAHALGRGIRFPLADDRLARFVNRLPRDLKFGGGRNKVILRAYMAKHLPAQILTKPKAPFVFDLNRLLRNPEYGWIEDLDRNGALRVVPQWNAAAIARLRQRHAAAPDDPRSQYPLYALGLLASFVAIQRGWTPTLAS